MVHRKKGRIVNIGSIAGDVPYPGGNVYGATKAFVHQFTNNLNADLVGTGVMVTSIEPGLCGGTEFSEVRFKGDPEKAAAPYREVRPLSTQDIVDAVAWVVERGSRHHQPNHLDQVGDLTQTDCPDQGASVCEELQPLLPALDHLGLIARVTLRRRQIIVEPGAGMNVSDLWRRISILLERNPLPNIRAVRSCRSVDILAPGVSKAGLLEHMRKTFRFSGPILCVGDQGSKAGNDFELLSTPYSLSVDQVSNDPETCWNLGPVGLDGVERTLYYLNQLTVDEPGILQINL